MQPEEIENLIVKGICNAEAYVEGDGSHFTALVISPAFAGKSRIQKQQMVYGTVSKQLLDGTLHALSIKAFTPDECQVIDNADEKDH